MLLQGILEANGVGWHDPEAASGAPQNCLYGGMLCIGSRPTVESQVGRVEESLGTTEIVAVGAGRLASCWR